MELIALFYEMDLEWLICLILTMWHEYPAKLETNNCNNMIEVNSFRKSLQRLFVVDEQLLLKICSPLNLFLPDLLKAKF